MNQRLIKYISHTLLIALLVVAAACSSSKYIPEGKYLLSKNTIAVSDEVFTQKELQRYVRQKPNKKIFGFFRFHMGLYNLSNPDKESRIQDWLRRIGEEPVVFEPGLMSRTNQELSAFLKNKGYHHASIVDSVTYRKKRAEASYTIVLGKPFMIDEIDWSSGRLIKNQAMRSLIAGDSINRLISPGMAFDMDALQAERIKLNRLIRNQGYYAFSKEYIWFEADTFPESKTVNLTLGIKEPLASYGNQDLDHKKFKIKDIRIVGDFDPREYMKNPSSYFDTSDTVQYNNLDFIYSEALTVRKNLLSSSIYLHEDSLFSQDAVDKTYASLAGLRNYSPINIKFISSAVNPGDSIVPMDCQIELAPLTRQSYDVSFEVTHSSGNFGAAGNLIYNHRNLFKGAESFDLKFKGAIEFLTNSGSDFNRMIEYGVDSRLNVPQFWLPIRLERWQQKYKPRTFVSINYNYQSRPEITRTIAAANFGYQWRSSAFAKHEIKLVDLNYVNVREMSDRFKEVISGTYFEDSYQSHVIPAFNYTFTWDNQTLQKDRDAFFFTFHPEIAGNLFSAGYQLAGTPRPEEGYYFFDTPYSQYFLADIDFRFHKVINPANRFALRFFAGAGYPYGNADVMPFEKKYFSGGSNGIRAWQVRSLGPGSYALPENQDDLFPNQLGDIKLESNLEYRFDLFGSVKGAVFLDAGNVWTVSPAEDQPGSTFKWDQFYKEIALGTGAGMRLDLTFFVLRLDLGMKLRDPGVQEGSGWIPFVRPYTFRDFVLNFAIGYPF